MIAQSMMCESIEPSVRCAIAERRSIDKLAVVEPLA
jgi:hypothetical protein